MGASKLERTMKAFKSLVMEDKVQKALEELHKDVDILQLHETQRQANTSDLILSQLSELTMMSKTISGSFGKDQLLALAQTAGKSLLEELSQQTQSMLVINDKGLLFRFSQLPSSVQETFIAQQEQQLRSFVEQEESRILQHLTVFDTRDRLLDYYGVLPHAGPCEWVLLTREYADWAYGSGKKLWLRGGPSVGKTVVSAFITRSMSQRLPDGHILTVYACSSAHGTSATSVLCALAGQIAQSSPTSMVKGKKFIERHISGGQLKPEILDLQDLIVEMSLSADIKSILCYH